MAIIDMKKITLIALEEERDKIVSLLQNLSNVEVTDGKILLNEEEWEGMVHAQELGQDINLLDDKIADLQFAIGFLRKYDETKKGMFGGKHVLSFQEYQSVIDKEDKILEGVAECRRLDRELSDLRNQETRLHNIIRQMESWKALSLPLEEVHDTRETVIAIGVLPLDQTIPFQEQLLSLDPPCYFDLISQDNEQSYGLLVYHKGDREIMQERLKEFGWNTVAFPNLSGTPGGIIQSSEEELKTIAQQQTDIAKEAARLVPEKIKFETLYDYLILEKDKKTVAENFARTEKTFVLEGWIPSEQVDHLEKNLGKVTEAFSLSVRDPAEGELFPTALKNPPLIEPYEMITDLYNTPSSRGIDPNLYMAPFYFAFFGMMVSDAGYGIVMAIVATIAVLKLNPQGMARKLGWILAMGGVSTFIWGSLFGGWFGIELRPLWFNPMKDPIMMLGLCFGLGALQVFVGMGLQAYMNIKRGKVWDAIFDQGLWYVFLIGLPLLAVSGLAQVGKVMCIAGAIGLVLTQGRTEKGIVKKFFTGLLSLYNVTSFLSDILSYSRLFALGLATGVIAMVINTIAAMLGGNIIGKVFMVVILIGGHAFNILINVLGAYVHASRLQYIEFFGKFFEGGGKAFSPFRMKTKYIEVQK